MSDVPETPELPEKLSEPQIKKPMDELSTKQKKEPKERVKKESKVEGKEYIVPDSPDFEEMEVLEYPMKSYTSKKGDSLNSKEFAELLVFSINKINK